MKILVELSSREEASLVEKAQQLNVQPEALAGALFRDILGHSSEDFARAAERVLQKNRELYKALELMRHLTLEEVFELHRRVIAQAGGSAGLRDMGALESAVAQPRMSFGSEDLYASLEEKATALGFSLIQNHPFTDGNKRVGHAAMETLLVLNGLELSADIDEAEQVILGVAAGQLKREDLLRWVRSHVVPLQGL